MSEKRLHTMMLSDWKSVEEGVLPKESFKEIWGKDSPYGPVLDVKIKSIATEQKDGDVYHSKIITIDGKMVCDSAEFVERAVVSILDHLGLRYTLNE